MWSKQWGTLYPEQTSMKEQINKLKINGNIYFWKYLENSRNYPGWNFTVNKIGGENLLELIRLMRTCEWSSKKSIQITEPSQKQLKVPNNSNGKAKWKTFKILTLNHRKDFEKEYWKIIENPEEVEIIFGEEKLIKFESFLSRILNNDGDFSISDNDEENILYFW